MTDSAASSDALAVEYRTVGAGPCHTPLLSAAPDSKILKRELRCRLQITPQSQPEFSQRALLFLL